MGVGRGREDRSQTEEGRKGRTRLDFSYFLKKIKYLMSEKKLGRGSPGVLPSRDLSLGGQWDVVLEG